MNIRSNSRERILLKLPEDSVSSSKPRQSVSASRQRNFNDLQKQPVIHSKIYSADTKNLPPKPSTAASKSRNALLSNIPASNQNDARVFKSNRQAIEAANCDWCEKFDSKRNLFKTPKCPQHSYCEECVKRPCQSNLSQYCQKCLAYFNCIGRGAREGELRCNLCPRIPGKNSLNCKVHGYCNECKEFVENNEYGHIVNLMKCKSCVENAERMKIDEECKDDIENEGKVNEIKDNVDNKLFSTQWRSQTANDKKRPNENIFKIPGLNQTEEPSILKTLSQKPNINPFFVNPENNTVPDKFEILNPGSQKIPQTFCDGCNTTKNIEDLLKIPKCLYHSYCENCINNQVFNQTCQFCKKYFEYIGKIPQIHENRCNLCSDKSTPSDFSCNEHQYCIDCQEFVEKNKSKHIHNLMKCEKCKINAKALKGKKSRKDQELRLSLSPESPHKPRMSARFSNKLVLDLKTEYSEERNYINLQPISTRNSTVFEVRCSNCQGKQGIFGFLCNHNSCIFCITSSCLKEILEFFQQYQADPNKIKDSFSYKCPITHCEGKISVPTLMVIKNHEKFMKDPAYNSNNKIFDFVKLDFLLPWVPYFDGLSAWSVY